MEQTIRCDCHKNQTMAVVRDGVLVIMQRAHGVTHTARIPLDKLREHESNKRVVTT